MQADEGHPLRIAAALIARLAVIGGRRELCADLLGELAFFDVCSLAREALERRIVLLGLDLGELLVVAQAVLGRFLSKQKRRGANYNQRRG